MDRAFAVNEGSSFSNRSAGIVSVDVCCKRDRELIGSSSKKICCKSRVLSWGRYWYRCNLEVCRCRDCFGGQPLRISSKVYEQEGNSGTRGRGNEEWNMKVKTQKHRVVASDCGELDWVDAWRKRTTKKEKGRANSTNMVSKTPKMNRPRHCLEHSHSFENKSPEDVVSNQLVGQEGS